ncbi:MULTISPECIES: hemolysin family protein [unclassified Paenibacillus]|uniref:hemolysin family protein n=1 Tax=unclassified Paenibacillus TaxID=185978 RepID=UPI002406200E|nr:MULTISPECIES: hemolysin family protein [unclassified Paenibacillus]MDF9841169.1 CBS domain containing-hemolysin-like protein [Paenibacillus sp. PastF-2]MDF9847659.1 CBS domain containing-hemolysin-like protein [Paenibacillus sp. PastM-2]MDF9854228.1 CBS domain containing-hemolysin-like protein [Paenibacillus sp. PastF-1]MDH6479601.1 CBS domain containing-hemolysin-like protein [Paenibacillus sp. PastH-2]MDH6505266.1 CBS domain containing-hemolysin-like protein [Paenibacillus sp. PastM-3]
MSDPLPGILHVGLIILLVLFNGFFVSVEYAMVKVRSGRIESLIEEGSKRALAAKNIVHNLDAYLSACQLGITLASLALGWLGEPAVATIVGPLVTSLGFGDAAVYVISLIIALMFITVLHIVLGELAPKTIAVNKAEAVLLLTSGAMNVFYRIMYPFIWIVNGLARGLLRIFRLSPASELATAHTEEEIRIIMQESNKSGLIDNTEMTLVDNIFEFADTMAREIMIPRTEMICLNSHLPVEENLEIAFDGMRTRYPVCDGDKDHILGFIHIKDLIRENTPKYSDLIRPILTVPESIQISALLKVMQRAKTQIAILIDEYGGTSGMVTLEDIMEEIVGEIQDEFDEERPGIEKLGEDEYSIDGLMLIEEINDLLGLHMETDDYDTVGGWMYSKLEVNPPQKGQSVEFGSHLFVVEETENKRISRIKLLKLQILSEEAGA